MVQILLMLEVLFTQDSKFEDLFSGASSGSEPSLFCSNYFFSFGFKPIQDDFQHDFARMTDEADSSVVLKIDKYAACLPKINGKLMVSNKANSISVRVFTKFILFLGLKLVSGTDTIQSQISSTTSRGEKKHKTRPYLRHSSGSLVNSHFQYRWSPASLTLKIYFTYFLFLYLIRRSMNSNTLHLKPPKKGRLV